MARNDFSPPTAPDFMASAGETQYIRALRDSPSLRAPDAPTFDLARSIAGRIEIHILHNNFEAAQDVLAAGLAAHLTELKERAQRRLRTRSQWLQAPLADLDLPLRLHNALENQPQNCENIGDAIALMNSGVYIPNVSTVAISRFWRAIESIGLISLRTRPQPTEKELTKLRDAHNQAELAKHRRKVRRRAQVEAGGLGGRKAYARGPERIIRSGRESA